MLGLIALVVLIGGGFTFIVVRISVSCVFWACENPKDTMHVVKYFFPYYIIALFTLCVVAIIKLDQSIFVICYSGFVFIIALLIWRYEIKNKPTLPKNEETQHPKLP